MNEKYYYHDENDTKITMELKKGKKEVFHFIITLNH